MEEKQSKLSIFIDGIFKNNQALVVLLGMCPTLAMTSKVNTAIGMSIAFLVVLIASNVIISLTRNLIPDEVRLPIFIIIIASLVSIVDLVLHAYAFTIYQNLAIFLQLIVVNCIILGRAEAYASKNKPIDSLFDALGIGAGYILALLGISVLREFISTGGIVFSNPISSKVIFDTKTLISESIINTFKISIIGEAVGAFLTLGVILAIINVIKARKTSKGGKK
jgi:electron transport complex protein RnfE